MEWPNKRVAWSMVGVLTFAYAVAYADRLILSLLVEPIKGDLKLTDTEISLIVGASFAIFYSISGLPIARYADRGNRKRLLLFSATAWSAMTALCGMAQGFWTLLAARVGTAVGEAGIVPTSLSMIADSFPPGKRARPISVWFLGAVIAAVGAFAGGAVLIAADGPLAAARGAFALDAELWRLTLFTLGLLGVPLLVLLVTLREPARQERASTAAQMPLSEVWHFVKDHRAMFVRLFSGAALLFLVFDAVYIWVATFLVRAHGMSVTESGTYVGIVSLLFGVCGPLGAGYLHDMLRSRGHRDAAIRAMLWLICLSAIGISFAPIVGSATLALLGFGIFITGLSGASILPQIAMQIILPNEIRAQINAGFLLIVNVVGFGVGPTATALVTDRVFKDESMLGYSMLVVSAIFLPLTLLTLWRSRAVFVESADRLARARPA
jgi:predicted MFS family arabinose efflux permease